MNYVYQPTHTSTLHTHQRTYTCNHTHFHITHTPTHVHMQAHTPLHYTHTNACTHATTHASTLHTHRSIHTCTHTQKHTHMHTHTHTQDGVSQKMFRIIAFFPQHHTVISECFKVHTVAEGKPTCTQPWTSVTCSLAGAHVGATVAGGQWMNEKPTPTH